MNNKPELITCKTKKVIVFSKGGECIKAWTQHHKIYFPVNPVNGKEFVGKEKLLYVHKLAAKKLLKTVGGRLKGCVIANLPDQRPEDRNGYTFEIKTNELLHGVLAAIRMKGKKMYWSKSLNCNVVEGLKLDERIDD